MDKRCNNNSSSIPRIMTAAAAIKPATEPPLILSVPTPEDFYGMAVLQTAAFVEKQAWGDSTSRIQENNYKTYQRYYNECPTKLKHCRIIKSPDGKSVQAACQLQLRRQPKAGSGEVDVFVEWIACHPDHMNKGLGSTLLAWAAIFAKQELKANILTLYVVKANTGAVRLYQRRGFVVDKGGRPTMCSKVVDGILSVVCLGIDRHFTVLTMEKDLSVEEETVIAASQR